MRPHRRLSKIWSMNNDAIYWWQNLRGARSIGLRMVLALLVCRTPHQRASPDSVIDGIGGRYDFYTAIGICGPLVVEVVLWRGHNRARYMALCWLQIALGMLCRELHDLHRMRSHFTGKERDAESGNDYFGKRYYSSSMGRWMSPDVINVTDERFLSPANTLNK